MVRVTLTHLLICIVLLMGSTCTLVIENKHQSNYSSSSNNNNTNNKTNEGHYSEFYNNSIGFKITTIGPLFVFLWQEIKLPINYTMLCESNDDRSTYKISIRSSSEEYVQLKTTSLIVTCGPGNDAVLGADGRDEFRDIVAVDKEMDDVERDAALERQSVVERQGVLFVTVEGTSIDQALLEFTACLLNDTNADRNTTNHDADTIGQDTSIDCAHDVLQQSVLVIVMKEHTKLDSIFSIALTVSLAIITLGFGAKLDPVVVKEALKKPIALTIGFCCQYFLMPLIAYTIARTLPIDRPTVAFGLFVCGVCPGGGASNMHTLLFDGDVSLSVTMTFISTITAVGMMPLWVYTLGRTFFTENFQPVIPYTAMLQVMATFIIPLLIGAAIQWKAPRVAKKMLKFLKPFTLIVLLAGIVIGVWVNWQLFTLFKPIYFLAGCMLPYIGYTLGGLAAIICRQPKARVIAIAIETGMQNAFVGTLLVLFSFPPPNGFIAAIAPMVSGLMTPLLPFFLFLLLTIYRKCFKTYNPVSQGDDETKGNEPRSGEHQDYPLVERHIDA